MTPMLAGLVAAVATFIALGFVSLGFYVSVGGLLIAGAISALVGVLAGALVYGARKRDGDRST